jgi:hypothetical protein
VFLLLIESVREAQLPPLHCHLALVWRAHLPTTQLYP